METLDQVNYVILHHTERTFDFASFIKFRHTCFRGWDDIGYHYLIGNGKLSQDGRIYTGRPECYIGAHAYGHNTDSLGISLIGNLDIQNPTDKQLESLRKLTREKLRQYNLSPSCVLGHSELEGVTKTCPGSQFNLDEFRESL